MTNEAAERLRRWLAVDGRYTDAHPMVDLLVDEALATERRNERARYMGFVETVRDTSNDPYLARAASAILADAEGAQP